MHSTVKVYKTDVDSILEAKTITGFLNHIFPDYDINFDLEDCDNVLRVESINGEIKEEEIIHVLESFGHSTEPLPA